MRVRPAGIDDIARLMAIERQSENAAHWSEREYQTVFARTHPDENLVDASRVPRRLCLAVEFADATVGGFLVALCLGSDWEIENVAVDPAFRRRGCANLLLQEFIGFARNMGAERILLAVRESNEAARALYAKWLFQQIGRRKNYYRDPEEDAILLHFECIHRAFKNG